MLKMWLSIQITIFILYCNPAEFSRHSYINKALEKAKTYYKSHVQKAKNLHFLGHDASEYPGKNQKYKQLNKDKWEEYYNCLHIQNQNLGTHRSVIPEAIIGFEGNFVSLDCRICLSPKEKSNIDSVTWFWTSLQNNKLLPVEYTEHIFLSPEDKTLTLYNLEKSQTGQYICKLGTSLTAPYFLTVVDSSKNITEVHSKFAKDGPYAKESECIEEYKILLDTVWSEWSPCSSCNTVGKRHKLGYCVFSFDEKCSIDNLHIPTNNLTHENIKQTNQTDGIPTNKQKRFSENTVSRSLKQRSDAGNKTSHIENTTSETSNKPSHTVNKTSQTVHNVSPADLELLNIFQNGIPCFSHILPRSIKELLKTKNRTNEIMVGYCKESCPEETVFEVRDKHGNVLETANNSAGIYSMLQDLPPIEPPVQRMLQYENFGQHITISCPGNLNSDALILWQLGTKKIIPELISKQSNNRIYISVTDKIHIQKAKISDSNIYSCWQNNELAGTVRLIVEKKITLTFNHHIMLFGMVVILATFLLIFTRAFLGRKYATT